MTVKCIQCNNVAVVRAGWVTNNHWMESDYCSEYMDKVWTQYKHTPAMSTATFMSPGKEIHNIKDIKQVSRSADRDGLATPRDLL